MPSVALFHGPNRRKRPRRKRARTLAGVKTSSQFCHERKKDPKKFDKRSFRTKVVSKNTRVVVGCPKGEWSQRTKRCKVGTQAQAILRRMPKGKVCCPKGQKIGRTKKRCKK